MLFAISQRQLKNKYGDFVDSLENNYIKYFEEFGIKFLIIPNCLSDVEGYFEEFDVKGIILTGGNNIDSRLYGEEGYDLDDVSIERDKTEKRLLEIAVKKDIPVLGICRGMQFINVFFGGGLEKIKDINESVEHVGCSHLIDIKDNLRGFLGEKASVNSFHNFGFREDKLANDLDFFAISIDGIIEGFFHKNKNIMGILWHPERKGCDEDINKKIIKGFLSKEIFSFRE